MKYTDEQRVEKIGETTAKLLAYLQDNVICQEDIPYHLPDRQNSRVRGLG